MVLPSGFGASSGELVEVAGFDMDVFLVTNLQYVDFLNHNRARIDQHILRLPDNFVTCLRIQISIDKYFKQLDKISEIAYRRKYIDKVKSP
jgi:formylglycine-generating enzyme required for sulfatase activity